MSIIQFQAHNQTTYLFRSFGTHDNNVMDIKKAMRLGQIKRMFFYHWLVLISIAILK